MKNYASLETLCALETGVTFRDRPLPQESGGVRLIALQDINRPFLPAGIGTPIAFEGQEHQHLQSGDILFKPRGAFTASIIEDIIDIAVTMAPVIRMRVRGKRLLAGYLLWYLQSRQAQRHLNMAAERSTLLALTKKQLGEMPIFLPKPDKQQKIADIYKAHCKSTALAYQKAELQAQYINAVLNKMIED